VSGSDWLNGKTFIRGHSFHLNFHGSGQRNPAGLSSTLLKSIVDTAPEETELRMVKSITLNLPPMGSI
jgi:hypothetical protein